MTILSKIYNHPWFPRLFYTKPDGGKDSGVTAYFLIEWKPVISICLLHFKAGETARENFHEHAFNALTWWLSGEASESRMWYRGEDDWRLSLREYERSLIPKVTKRDNLHKVHTYTDSWALSLRGPWKNTWREMGINGEFTTLTHGRKVVG